MLNLPAGLGPFLTVDTFRPYVGADFTANTVPQPVKITLYKVIDLSTPSWMERQSFNLIFTSPRTVLLLEGQYELKAPDGAGPWTIHIAPMPPTPAMPDLNLYQGMFN